MKVKLQKKLIWSALFFGLLFFLFSPSVSEARAPLISAKSAVIISLKDWQPLYDKSSDLRLPMASTTKVMTALLAVEYLQGDESVLISENATAVPPVKLGLIEGKRYRADDLLYGILLYSANDAGVALAEKVAGTEERFVGLMNQRARELGAFNTRFNNATGLPGEGQYTTVNNLALILYHALQNEKIVRVMQTRYASIDHNGRKLFLRNKNRLLWECPWTVGGKTGFTRMAGHCYVGEIKNEDNEFIVALLGSKRLWADATALVDYGNKRLTSPREEEITPATKVKKTTNQTARKIKKGEKAAKKQTAFKSKKTEKKQTAFKSSKTTRKQAAFKNKKITKKRVASRSKKIKKTIQQATKKDNKHGA
ncbi:MAG: serine hydrolase [Proteobacteria bacterium]|nr:serine hydrolase [Pseudomonadota bacterium]